MRLLTGLLVTVIGCFAGAGLMTSDLKEVGLGMMFAAVCLMIYFGALAIIEKLEDIVKKP